MHGSCRAGRRGIMPAPWPAALRRRRRQGGLGQCGTSVFRASNMLMPLVLFCSRQFHADFAETVRELGSIAQVKMSIDVIQVRARRALRNGQFVSDLGIP